MFRRRSSRKTSSWILPLSTTFPQRRCSSFPRVRIRLSTWSIPVFDHVVCIRIDPPTSNVAPSDPQGQVPNPFSFPLSTINATKLNGGTVKIVDSSIFKISTTIAVADVTVEPGALRELHVSAAPSWLVRLISTLSSSGTRHKTSGFMSCNDNLLNRINFCTETRYLEKATHG